MAALAEIHQEEGLPPGVYSFEGFLKDLGIPENQIPKDPEDADYLDCPGCEACLPARLRVTVMDALEQRGVKHKGLSWLELRSSNLELLSYAQGVLDNTGQLDTEGPLCITPPYFYFEHVKLQQWTKPFYVVPNLPYADPFIVLKMDGGREDIFPNEGLTLEEIFRDIYQKFTHTSTPSQGRIEELTECFSSPHRYVTSLFREARTDLVSWLNQYLQIKRDRFEKYHEGSWNSEEDTPLLIVENPNRNPYLRSDLGEGYWNE